MKRLLALSVLLIVGVSSPPFAQAGKKRLTLALATRRGAIVSRWISRLRWRPHKDQISYLRYDASGGATLRLYDVAARQETLLLDPDQIRAPLHLESYRWSPAGDSLLFLGKNNLWLYDVPSGKARRLTRSAVPEKDPTFSPDGRRVAFVRASNLYTLNLATGNQRQLTTDGSAIIYNGRFDWVYKEELSERATGRAYRWSPDGKMIAFLRLDDGPVPVYPITHYLSTHVTQTLERFPQAGDPNPIASFHVVTVGPARHEWSRSFGKADNVEYLGPQISWLPNSSAVAFLTLNRPQTVEKVHLWNPASGDDQTLVTETDPYWINSLTAPYFLKNGRRFLWLSERDGWQHLYLYRTHGQLIRKLTSGDWMIDHPALSNVPKFQVDPKRGWVYFEATLPSPLQRQIYRARLNGRDFERVSKPAGTHVFTLSPDGRYLVDVYSNYKTPPETFLLSNNGKTLATLDQPKNHLAEYDLGVTKFVHVRAPDGTLLDARLVLPPDFDPHKKYPVIVYVYGGPGFQMVRNAWGVTSFFDLYLAQQGYLVWTLDNRGSWGRGHAFESVIFEHLGQHELADQLTGVNYLKSLPYVDPNRFGIWGWSYGGYMTLYALTHAPGVFKCGAAGGPVTDWKFYDSIYTERYMRTPRENPLGYRKSSPLRAASRLRAKVLLIHGADDDNVHMQNTLNFVNALVEAKKPFSLYIQPGQKHGFVGYTDRVYLVRRLYAFFKKNL